MKITKEIVPATRFLELPGSQQSEADPLPLLLRRTGDCLARIVMESALSGLSLLPDGLWQGIEKRLKANLTQGGIRNYRFSAGDSFPYNIDTALPNLRAFGLLEEEPALQDWVRHLEATASDDRTVAFHIAQSPLRDRYCKRVTIYPPLGEVSLASICHFELRTPGWKGSREVTATPVRTEYLSERQAIPFLEQVYTVLSPPEE